MTSLIVNRNDILGTPSLPTPMHPRRLVPVLLGRATQMLGDPHRATAIRKEHPLPASPPAPVRIYDWMVPDPGQDLVMAARPKP